MGKRSCTAWGRGGVLHGDEEVYCMGKRRCTAWGRGGALHGEEEVYCMGKRRCILGAVSFHLLHNGYKFDLVHPQIMLCVGATPVARKQRPC